MVRRRNSPEHEEKLAVLRDLAADAFGAIDRGEGIAIEGEEKLAEFIRGIGRRAVQPAHDAMRENLISPQAQQDIEAVVPGKPPQDLDRSPTISSPSSQRGGR